MTQFDIDGEDELVEDSAATATPVILDPAQEQAINACSGDSFTDISGTAGVGKTFVAKEIVKRHPGVVLAATTGIASVNLGEGTTINSLLKYFDTRSLQESYMNGSLKSILNKHRRAGVLRILIDEKSMMHGAQLTAITRAVREVNEGGVYALEGVGVGENEDDPNPLPSSANDLPPMGITLVGDFGQLPPVPDEDPLTGKKLPIEFCFDSPEWPLFAANRSILTKIFRQDAQDFVGALHAIRKGNVLQALQFFNPTRFSAATDDSFEGSTIFAKNDQVERYNLLRLDKLPGAPLIAKAIRIGKQRPDWKLVPDTLVLKENALVMILANRREYEDEFDERGRLIYANGDLGTIVGVRGTAWMVKLHRTGGVVPVYPIRRENTIPLEPGRRKELKAMLANGQITSLADKITENGKGKSEIIGTIDYMPLRAAYGCTVHKTQGLTLDNVQVNIADPFFRHPGMLFVALSRARTAEGLRIIGSQTLFKDRCKIEPRVQPWL